MTEVSKKPKVDIKRKTGVVFGATGLVGKALINLLLSDNNYEKIVAVVRNSMPISHGKLVQIEITDYNQLDNFMNKLVADTYFCCIGTTIKKEGSQEAFRKVDHDIPVIIAQLAEALSVPSLVIISSIGANLSSPNFYLRIKGEMEKSVRDVYSGNLKFVRPSLLMGKISAWLFIGPLKKYKGLHAEKVAAAMIKIADDRTEKFIYESDELQDLISK